MVHPVMEAARRKLVRKLVHRTMVKDKKKSKSKSKSRSRPSQSTNHVMAFVDPQAKKRAWQEMIRQYSNGLIKARHPRVLTLELQRKEKVHKPRGTPARISNHSQGEFLRRSTRQPHPRNPPLDPTRDQLIAVPRSEMSDEDDDDGFLIERDLS
ncbi:hypothetical protein PGT21_027583 [Puccinia graminis f. sp. tritici]|uniref:Uncharacterized protein n=2 Tax=Puccinia graminis f. sp. tritici TaxID=56615 RepID=E3K397_PUCGT|nr:uncharacterized protein PGTG_04910 [Puccinia graminis f. sp. tritici CRL 75-36-700-3]EFP78954.1 hypothetical protein PGTG_04910 [Puccinia graminis f. sp. tritici CRL 75-36-700-3]KAA1068346.1 hypothetical protein PGTUg99_001745 [Puccinia graminis f. sp. tritici]KAA1069588.1 hypothetical protein PGT21_028756 [Puccinia graminis f. sp. tritici]KAA1104593.1 hypothetical protein PGT21_027583 [Puccinia graminis f. sp. tritici]